MIIKNSFITNYLKETPEDQYSKILKYLVIIGINHIKNLSNAKKTSCFTQCKQLAKKILEQKPHHIYQAQQAQLQFVELKNQFEQINLSLRSRYSSSKKDETEETQKTIVQPEITEFEQKINPFILSAHNSSEILSKKYKYNKSTFTDPRPASSYSSYKQIYKSMILDQNSAFNTHKPNLKIQNNTETNRVKQQVQIDSQMKQLMQKYLNNNTTRNKSNDQILKINKNVGNIGNSALIKHQKITASDYKQNAQQFQQLLQTQFNNQQDNNNYKNDNNYLSIQNTQPKVVAYRQPGKGIYQQKISQVLNKKKCFQNFKIQGKLERTPVKQQKSTEFSTICNQLQVINNNATSKVE